MQRFMKRYGDRKGDIIFICTVAVAWLSGLLAGVFSAFCIAGHICNSLGFFDIVQSSNVVAILTSLIPLFICAILYWLNKPGFIIPVVICKAFCYGFCSQAVMFAFDRAGWIMHWLLMFADSFSVVLFLFFLFSGRGMAKKAVLGQLALCVAIVLVIVCIDIYAVQPILIALA